MPTTLISGYQHSATLTHYAHYLHARITAYRTLKHDMVRVQAENNRASAYRTQSEGASGVSLVTSDCKLVPRLADLDLASTAPDLQSAPASCAR